MHGECTFEWLEGRRFVIQRWQYDHPELPDAIAIIGVTNGQLAILSRAPRAHAGSPTLPLVSSTGRERHGCWWVGPRGPTYRRSLYPRRSLAAGEAAVLLATTGRPAGGAAPHYRAKIVGRSHDAPRARGDACRHRCCLAFRLCALWTISTR